MIVLSVWVSGRAFAQTGGQFCVRAFEDRDGDGVWAGGGSEPLLTRDVAINLLNADGIVVASGLLEDSPTAAQGVLCFAFLPAGQYTAVVTSAEMTPTTPMSISALVEESGQPVVVEFGAQMTTPEPVESSTPTQAESDLDLLRVGLSAGGALLALLLMIGLGIVVYSLLLRRRTPARASAPTTGSMRAVTIEGSDQES